MKSIKTTDEIMKEETTADAITSVSEAEDSSSIKEKKVKKVMAQAKEKIVKNGKDSAINFAIKKIFSCLLSALLSFALVLFAQHSFKDNFKDYVKDFIRVNIKDFQELTEHISALEYMNYEEAAAYCEEYDIYEKSKNLLKSAVSYSSEDKDINMLHSVYTEVCLDMLDLSVMLCAPTFDDSSASDDVREISGIIHDGSVNMNVTGSENTDTDTETDSDSIQDDTSDNSEISVPMMRIKAKLEIFIELSNELCDKHGIKHFI